MVSHLQAAHDLAMARRSRTMVRFNGLFAGHELDPDRAVNGGKHQAILP